MFENKLVRENIEGNCKRNIGKQKFKEKHKCDKSNFLTRHSSAIGMRLWKMWREAKSRVSAMSFSLVQLVF